MGPNVTMLKACPAALFADACCTGRSIRRSPWRRCGPCRDDRQRLVQAYGLAGLPEKCLRSTGCSARCQAEVDEPAVLIDRPPQIAPTAVHPKVGFVNVPCQAAPTAMAAVGALADLGAELLDLAIDSCGIDGDAAFRQQVATVALGQRVAAVPPHGQQDHDLRKPMASERFASRQGRLLLVHTPKLARSTQRTLQT